MVGRALSASLGIHIPVTEAAATNWFIWALGALSVEAALGLIKLPRWCFNLRAAGVALGCAMGLAQLLPLVDQTGWVHNLGWLIMHPAWGVGFFILVNYAVEAEQRWRVKSLPVPRLIPSLASVGLMSYSLYLIHSFVLMHWYWFGFTRFHILTISLLIMTPLSVAFAWVFFRVFERPFMSRGFTRTNADLRSSAEIRGEKRENVFTTPALSQPCSAQSRNSTVVAS
jgi:peptidoglycan/LPS O-acetylase OafA/YrhL